MITPFESHLISTPHSTVNNGSVHPAGTQQDAFGRQKPKLSPLSIGILALAAVAAVVLMLLGK